MNSNLYTNTKSVKSIAGLIATTILVSYASQNATEIVNKVVNLTKQGARKANEVVHGGMKQYATIARDADGNWFDTGRRFWRK